MGLNGEVALPVRVQLEHEEILERFPTEIRKNCWATTRTLSEIEINSAYSKQTPRDSAIFSVILQTKKSSRVSEGGHKPKGAPINPSQAGVIQRPVRLCKQSLLC